MPVSAGLAALLDVLLSGPHAQTLIDKIVGFCRQQLDSQRVMIRVRIHERSPWWLPKFVDQEIFDQLVGEIERILDAVATDPNHPARTEIAAGLSSLQHSLATDPELAAKSRALQTEVIEHPRPRAALHLVRRPPPLPKPRLKPTVRVHHDPPSHLVTPLMLSALMILVAVLIVLKV